MKARIETELGAFDIELALDDAPVTANYFREVIQSGAYSNASFFRIVCAENASLRVENPIEVIQGGLTETDTQPVAPIRHEPTSETGLTHKKWSVSTARHEAGETFGSFFVCMRDEPELDFAGKRHPDGLGFAVFGEVVSGFDTVEKIFARREDEEFLKNQVVINSGVILADK